MSTQPSDTQDGNLAYGPALPPRMAAAHAKPLDTMVAELKETPLFMTSLPDESADAEGDSDGGNIAIEALKALKVEGTPLENAQECKELGNEFFAAKAWKNARAEYGRGIDMLEAEEQRRQGKSSRSTSSSTQKDEKKQLAEDASSSQNTASLASYEQEAPETVQEQRILLETLYTNRAAAQLSLCNNRSAALDCAAALRLNPRNVKALYRAGRALLAAGRVPEADDACARGLALDAENAALRKLAADIVARAKADDAKAAADRERREKEARSEKVLDAALAARGIVLRWSLGRDKDGKRKMPETASFSENARIKLVPDSLDPTSRVSFPVALMYTSIMESDFVEEFVEDECLAVHLERVFPLPWDTKKEYTTANVECYMERCPANALGRGGASALIKIGKKVPLLKVLVSGKVEIVDGILKIYIVPKDKSEAWIKEYKQDTKHRQK